MRTGRCITGVRRPNAVNERELKVLCRAVGDVTRIRMLRLLADEPEMSVTDLAGELVLSQPLASWHIRILRRAGILSTRKDRRQVYCSLDRDRVTQFQEGLGDLVRATSGQQAPAYLAESLADAS